MKDEDRFESYLEKIKKPCPFESSDACDYCKKSPCLNAPSSNDNRH